MLDMIIRGGQVVTPQGSGEMEVAIQGGKIAALSHPGTLEAEAPGVLARPAC